MGNVLQLLLNAVLVYWGTQAVLHLLQAVRFDEKRNGREAEAETVAAPYSPNDRLPWRRMIGPVHEAHFRDVIGNWDDVVPRTPPPPDPHARRKPRGEAGR